MPRSHSQPSNTHTNKDCSTHTHKLPHVCSACHTMSHFSTLSLCTLRQKQDHVNSTMLSYKNSFVLIACHLMKRRPPALLRQPRLRVQPPARRVSNPTGPRLPATHNVQDKTKQFGTKVCCGYHKGLQTVVARPGDILRKAYVTWHRVASRAYTKLCYP